MVIMNDLVLFGYIAKAVGLKGGLKLKLINSESEALIEGMCLTLKHGKLPPKQFIIRHVDSNDRVFFEGLNDRTAAETLQGSEVFINRADLPATDPDEYYLNDLIDAEVTLVSGEVLGHICSFASNSAQTLLEVKTPEGRIVSIPLVPAIVVSIDEKNKRIVVDPPLGLLDLE